MKEKRDFTITRREITYVEANKVESPTYEDSKLEVKIGEIEPAAVPDPFLDTEYRQLAAIDVTAPGTQRYEAYILNKDRKVIARVYVEDGEYLGNGLVQQAKWKERIYYNPAENINAPSGKYTFTIKCYGANNQIKSAEKEFQLDVDLPILSLHDKSMIVSDSKLIFSVNKPAYVDITAYNEYGEEIEYIGAKDRLYESNVEHRIDLKDKGKIGYVWVKAKDKYGNTSAKVIDLARSFSEKVKQHYLVEMTSDIEKNEPKNEFDYNFYNGVLSKSRRLLEKGNPVKAVLLLEIWQEKAPQEDVYNGLGVIKGAFGAMAQMEIARIYAEYLNDYQRGVDEYRKAIKKYEDVKIGFIERPMGPYGKSKPLSMIEIATIFNCYLNNYDKALDEYHDFLKAYNDEWYSMYEGGGSLDLEVFNSIINISKIVYGGGDRTIDQCKKVIAETKNDNIACEALIKIAEVYSEQKKYNEAINTYAEIISQYPTAEIYFPYAGSLNYSSLARIRIFEIYQDKLKNLNKLREFAEETIKDCKDKAIVDLAYKKLDEISPPESKIVEKLLIKYQLPKYAEWFHLNELISEKNKRLYFFGGYDYDKIIYSWKHNEELREVGRASKNVSGGESKWKAWVSDFNSSVFIKGFGYRDFDGESRKCEFLHKFTEIHPGINIESEFIIAYHLVEENYESFNKIDTKTGEDKWFYLLKQRKLHRINEISLDKKIEKKTLYTSSTTTEPIIDYVSDGSNLYVLHPHKVTVKNLKTLNKNEITINDRKYSWPRKIWLSPDSNYLIIWDSDMNQETTFLIINLNNNVQNKVVLSGLIKSLLFTRDSQYVLINRGREPFYYKYADSIPAKIDVHEFPSMKFIESMYVDGDAVSVLLSKNGDRLWVLCNRKHPVISVVDLKKVLK